jgi:hypothetical protein
MHTYSSARAHTQKYLTLTAFNCINGFANAPQCYVIRTLHVLLLFATCFGFCKSLFRKLKIYTKKDILN